MSVLAMSRLVAMRGNENLNVVDGVDGLAAILSCLPLVLGIIQTFLMWLKFNVGSGPSICFFAKEPCQTVPHKCQGGCPSNVTFLGILRSPLTTDEA
jgi:hypothetical protein